MKLLLAIAGPFLFCIGVAFTLHLWNMVVRRGATALETHRWGAIVFWALMCSGYLSELAMKVQSYMIHSGFSGRTSHHIFGLLLVFVAVAAAGMIDFVSKNVADTRLTVD